MEKPSKTISKMAAALARRGRGKPKHFSKEELELRRERLRKARLKRWKKAAGTAAVLLFGVASAKAIPGSELRAQAHQRVDIEWDVLDCTAYADNCSPKEKAKIVANI